MGNLKLLSERLQWCIDRKREQDPEANVTKKNLADVAGRSRAAVTYWFQDVNGLDADAARKLGGFFEVDPVWLETGAGKPEPEASERQAALSASSDVAELAYRKVADMIETYILASPRDRERIDFIFGDVRGKIAASHKTKGGRS